MFGHWGAGGQMAYCDPENRVGWAYVTNYCNILHGFTSRTIDTQLSKEPCTNALQKLIKASDVLTSEFTLLGNSVSLLIC